MVGWSAERAGAPQARDESLRRANTTHVVPVVAIVVVGIQTRAIPVQVVAIRRAVRCRRPPVPVPGIVERTIVVVATSNRGVSAATLLPFLKGCSIEVIATGCPHTLERILQYSNLRRGKG